MASPLNEDLEKSNAQPASSTFAESKRRKGVNATPFVGRLGGNQAFVIDPNDAHNASLLAAEPDAAPGMSLKQQFDLRPFLSLGIWKAAVIEGVGKLKAFFHWTRRSIIAHIV